MAAARVCWSRRTVGALRNGNALPFGAVYACHSARIEARLPKECAQVVHPCAAVAVRQQWRPLVGAVLKLKSYPVAAGRLDGRETTVPRGELLVHLPHIVGHDAPPSSSPLDVLSNAVRISAAARPLSAGCGGWTVRYMPMTVPPRMTIMPPGLPQTSRPSPVRVS